MARSPSKEPWILRRGAEPPCPRELGEILAAYRDRQHPDTAQALADTAELLWPALCNEMSGALKEPKPPNPLEDELIFREAFLVFLNPAEAQALRLVGELPSHLALGGSRGPVQDLAGMVGAAAEDLHHVAWFLRFCEEGFTWEPYEHRMVILAADLAPAIEALAGALDLLRKHLEGLDESD